MTPRALRCCAFASLVLGMVSGAAGAQSLARGGADSAGITVLTTEDRVEIVFPALTTADGGCTDGHFPGKIPGSRRYVWSIGASRSGATWPDNAYVIRSDVRLELPGDAPLTDARIDSALATLRPSLTEMYSDLGSETAPSTNSSVRRDHGWIRVRIEGKQVVEMMLRRKPDHAVTLRCIRADDDIGKSLRSVPVRLVPDTTRQPLRPIFERIVLAQAGDAGVHTYRIPALVVARNGTLIAAFDARNDSPSDLPANIDVMVLRSTDLGRTWSPTRRIVDFDSGRGGGDPSLLLDGVTGRVFLFYEYAPAGRGIFNSNADRDSASTGTVHPHVMWSDDHGATWQGPRDLIASIKPQGATGMFATSGHGIQLSARSPQMWRLLQPYAWLDAERRMHAANAYSDDHGATWKLGASIGVGLDENKAVELHDGSVMQNIRAYEKTVTHRLTAISRDGGVTFGAATEEPSLPDPRNNADVIRVAPDAPIGSREERMLLFSNTADEKRRANLTVRLSCDDGRSWPVSKVVEPGPAMYSVMARLKDGTFGLLYENGAAQGLTFVRFDLAWVGGGCR